MIKPGIHERGPLKTIFNVDNSISKSQWLWSKSHKPINSNYQHILILTSWCDIQTSNFVFKCCVAERKKKKKKKDQRNQLICRATFSSQWPCGYQHTCSYSSESLLGSLHQLRKGSYGRITVS